MTGKQRPKLLFLLSSDHGELSNALYFLMGNCFDAVLLMPESLYSLNKSSLPVRAAAYRSGAEALAMIDAEQPDIVFLFSGYLYVINNLFDMETVSRLVSRQREEGQIVVTSDPFLGVLHNQGTTIFSDKHPQLEWLKQHFSALLRVFSDTWHLHLTPNIKIGDTKAMSFFNDRILNASREPAQKSWLFVMSKEDYGAQTSRLGQDSFNSVLSNLLRQSASHGARTILVAPAICCSAMRLQVPDIEAWPWCGHQQFMTMLLTAECAFFWNLFSNAISPRLINRLPVFFFDTGHMARAIPPLLEAGIKHYFAGAEPDLLDQRAALDAGELARLAARQDTRLEKARELFRSSSSPQAAIALLMEER